MAKQSPFLQRRGDAFGFRIAVPADLRPHVGHREFTRALGTTDKCQAVPLALAMAARAKRFFTDYRNAMSKKDGEKMRMLLEEARVKGFLRERIEELEEQQVAMRLRHLKELQEVREKATLQGRADALMEAAKNGALAVPAVQPSAGFTAPPAAPHADTSPKLGKIVKEFLGGYRQDKKSAMFTKHKTVLPLFVTIVGDKKVSQLKQADVNDFFEVVQKLPTRWSDQLRKRGITVMQLAAEHHEKTMAPKTFEDTYKACIRAFLQAAKRDWQDDGFPTTLTTDGAEYAGDRKEGERVQRAFKAEELRRLFEGDEMKELANDPHASGKFWLPHIGLFTGARVNEICQLNPQTDILEEDGIWHFVFTEDTEGGDGIKKSIKNKTSKRRVPIHSQLLSIGFLDYVQALRKAGAKQLFPAWSATRGKASPAAEKWFRRFLEKLGLRDQTPGAALLGMHAFRHNLLARARHLGIDGAIEITGHAGDRDAVVRGYEGELALDRKRAILEKIVFDVQLIQPVAPTVSKPKARVPKAVTTKGHR
jgi:integrase